MSRTIALLLTNGARAESTATALRLAERLLTRGHRVTVFAHEDAAALTAAESEVGGAVAALVHRGAHGATLDWVVDEPAARRLGCTQQQVPGVIPGGHEDLWAFVREADIVLAPGGES